MAVDRFRGHKTLFMSEMIHGPFLALAAGARRIVKCDLLRNPVEPDKVANMHRTPRYL